MEKKAIIAGIILSIVNFSAWANDSIEQSTTNMFKPFKIEMPLESAPPLTQLFVSSVYSTSVLDGEPITPGQISTKKHHQGPILYVNTVEIGIANVLITHMNGFELPISSMVQVKALCVDARGKVDICKNYGKRIGYWRTWDVAKLGIGSFAYQATSLGYPYNTKNTALYIQ